MFQNPPLRMEDDKLYVLKLYAMGQGYEHGRRRNPLDIDFHDDEFGRFLCNAYALSPSNYLFDTHQDQPARRTARIALEYARAYNAGQISAGNPTLHLDALIKSIPMSMSIAASPEQYETVLEELRHFDKRGEANIIVPPDDEFNE